MKLTKKVLTLVVLGGLSVSGSSLAEMPTAQALANTCAGCHGTDGSSNGPATPSLAGISVDYFKDAMESFQERKEQKFDAKLAKQGAKHHKKYCEKCHEDGGRSSEDDAGILAGQWMEYLHYTMDDFTNGRRDMPKKMKKRVSKLEKKHGPEALEALINYYGSQK